MADEPKADQPHVYTDLNEVPERWRIYKGARLSVEQVNALVARSYAISQNLSALATAREEFESLWPRTISPYRSKRNENLLRWRRR